MCVPYNLLEATVLDETIVLGPIGQRKTEESHLQPGTHNQSDLKWFRLLKNRIFTATTYGGLSASEPRGQGWPSALFLKVNYSEATYPFSPCSSLSG